MINGKISVLIPAYNEEKGILKTINETIIALEKIVRDFEIVIIDDGSRDKTYKIVHENLNSFNGKVKIERYNKNMGKGFAVKYGTNFLSGDYALFIDADMDIHPNQISNFLNLTKQYDADIVIGSKRHKDSIVNYPPIRRIYSNVYYLLIKILFGLPIKDTQTGFKLFKYNALKNSINKVIIKKYAFDLELLVVAKVLNYKIIECPIILKPTRIYNNRIGIRAIINILIDTLAIFYRYRILKHYEK